MRNIIILLAALFSTNLLAQTVPVRVSAISQLHATAEPTVAEAADFTAVADVAGSLGGKYFKFYTAADAKCYAPWFDVANGSTAPVVASCTLIEVDISADDADTAVALAARTAIGTATTGFVTVTGATTHIIMTSVLKGAATNATVNTSGFTVSLTQGVSGVAANATPVGNLSGFKICADAVQTATYVSISNSIDPENDGIRIGKGKCFECLTCNGGLLKLLKVSGQASAAAFAVTQYQK